MRPELLDSYRTAGAVARRRARNFYYSFVVLPPEKRRAFHAVYAFMRHCDDISDGTGATADKGESLRLWRSRLQAAAAGNAGDDGIFPAFQDAMRRFSIPAEYFHWIIDGAEMDLGIDRYETFEDLYRYCFHVASAVGLVCLHIFGFSEERAKLHAEHCGIAFQLTNILRDIREDAQMGRIYLPVEDLARFNYEPEELRQGILDERFRRLMTFETDRALEYYRSGRSLFPYIEEASRPALWAMMEIYGRILKRIVSRGYDVFGSSVRLSNPEKTAVALKALALRHLPGGGRKLGSVRQPGDPPPPSLKGPENKNSQIR